MLLCRAPSIWGHLLAVITGVGGGIIRDTIRSDHYIPSLKGEFKKTPGHSIQWNIPALYVCKYVRTVKFKPQTD